LCVFGSQHHATRREERAIMLFLRPLTGQRKRREWGSLGKAAKVLEDQQPK
jgi:hypothetical protein